MERSHNGDNDSSSDLEEHCEPKVEVNSKRSSDVWKYFKALGSDCQALCLVCRNIFSYRTTITNLKKHLYHKHSDIIGDNNPILSRFECNKKLKRKHWNKKKYSNSEDNSNTKVKFSSEILSQFDEEDGEMRCNDCKESVPGNLDDMKNHLEEQHSGVLDGIIAKVQKSQGSESEDENALGDNDIFTEVLYLEDESSTKSNYSPQRVKTQPKRRKLGHPSVNLVENSSTYETNTRIENQDDAELEVFLNYVRLLLRKVPKEKSQQLHLDMINLIMKTQMSTPEPRVIETENVPSDNVASVLENNIVFIKSRTNNMGTQKLIHLVPQNDLISKVSSSPAIP